LRFIALIVLLAVAAVPILEALPCDRDCAGDAGSGDCAPGCDDCGCCPLVRVLLPIVGHAAPVECVSRLLDEPLRPPPAPGPAEILHVPKLSIA
jgi:hypothetical protein